MLHSLGYDLKLNIVLKLDFDAFKKLHLIAPIILRELFARVSKGRARQDKIILLLKFGGNVICYFCAVWLENEARLISCCRSAMALLNKSKLYHFKLCFFIL